MIQYLRFVMSYVMMNFDATVIFAFFAFVVETNNKINDMQDFCFVRYDALLCLYIFRSWFAALLDD